MRSLPKNLAMRPPVVAFVFATLCLVGSARADLLLPFNPTGDLFALDNGSKSVLRFSPGGSVAVAISQAQITAVTGAKQARFSDNAIAFDAAGSLYFTETVSESILKFSGGTLSLVAARDNFTAATGAKKAEPTDITVGSDGFLYVMDGRSRAVVQVDPVTGQVNVHATEADLAASAPGAGVQLSGDGIVAGPDGTVYVSTHGGKSAAADVIFVIAPDGTPSVLAMDPGFSDLDVFLTLDQDGNIVVADDAGSLGDDIHRVTPDGLVSLFLSEAELESVAGDDVDLEGGIAFDSAGNFFLADKNTSTIYLFDPELNGWTFISPDQVMAITGMRPDYRSGIAFSPLDPSTDPSPRRTPTAGPAAQPIVTPEPASWLTWLVAAASIAWFRLRRNG